MVSRGVHMCLVGDLRLRGSHGDVIRVVRQTVEPGCPQEDRVPLLQVSLTLREGDKESRLGSRGIDTLQYLTEIGSIYLTMDAARLLTATPLQLSPDEAGAQKDGGTF